MQLDPNDSLDFSEVCTTRSDGEVVTRTFIGLAPCKRCKKDAHWAYTRKKGRSKKAEGVFCSIRCREMFARHGALPDTTPPPPGSE